MKPSDSKHPLTKALWLQASRLAKAPLHDGIGLINNELSPKLGGIWNLSFPIEGLNPENSKSCIVHVQGHRILSQIVDRALEVATEKTFITLCEKLAETIAKNHNLQTLNPPSTP